MQNMAQEPALLTRTGDVHLGLGKNQNDAPVAVKAGKKQL